jgi:probable F420-dependent oxidoreductase
MRSSRPPRLAPRTDPEGPAPGSVTIRSMDYGLALPNFLEGSSAEGIEAAAEAAERLGFSTVWTTDHVLIDHAFQAEYGRIYEAILTLAHVGARTSRLKLGTSVIVVPQRQAVVLAKELATLDNLTRGRLIAGVGAGWSAAEYANLGVADRFHVRGAYLDETMRLWRHLWSGSVEPFDGRFNHLTDFVFAPLPAQTGGPPIVVGGSSDAALRRAGMLGDGYQFSVAPPTSVAERVSRVRAAAESAGRPMPPVSGRVTLRFDAPPPAAGQPYAMTGAPEVVAAEVRAYAGAGVDHLALVLRETDPARYVAIAERFAREVMPLVE